MGGEKMATVEERMRILNMIQEGKISADQGVQLLQALDESMRPTRPAPRTSAPPPPIPGRSTAAPGGRWFRVLVTDMKTGRTRVNVRMPASLVSAGMKMGARFGPQVEGFSTEQLMEFLKSGATGRIVDVYNEEDGEHVEVYIE